MQDDVQDFVHVSNLRRFLGVLATDIDPVRRRVMHELLVEEENRLGRTLEQLDNSARWIEEGRARIAKVRDTAARADHSADLRGRANDLLATLQMTQNLLEQYHHTLSRELSNIDL